MTKVQVIGPKSIFYKTVGLLHQLGVLHIEDMSKKVALSDLTLRQMSIDESSERTKNDLENLLIRVNGILSTIEPEAKKEEVERAEAAYYREYSREDSEELVITVDELIKELEVKVRGLASRKAQLEMELSSMGKYQTIVEKVAPLAKQMIALEGFDTIAFVVERKYKKIIDLVHGELGRLTHNQFEIVAADVDEETTAALAIFNKKYSKQVHSFLDDNVTTVRLPESLADLPFDEALERIKERQVELSKEIAEVKQQLTEVSNKWYVKLQAIAFVLRDRIDELAAVTQFAQTDYTFVITGWLPKKQLSETEQVVKDEFGKRVVITELPLTHEELEEAPIVYENPSWAKPFEVVMRLMQPPRYGTVDPTPFLAIFFPAFFGIILGDIGYGLVILAIAFWARCKFVKRPIIQAISSIFIMAGISTVVFGAIYGEFFGDLPHTLHLVRPIYLPFWPYKLPYERTESEYMMGLLFVCLGVGFVHIVLGLILGIVNALREKSKRHAFEKVGMIVVLLSLIVIIMSVVAKFPVLKIPGALFIIIGIVLLLYGAGFLGFMEIFGVIGNVFSYARLMALGLAGAILAVVANELAGALGIALGALIALLLHTINIAVGAFSPSIHSIRLNIIEFFNKFYEPGGKEYRPFRARR
jgi:V/A-type H+-transporting ATPase subunit I